MDSPKVFDRSVRRRLTDNTRSDQLSGDATIAISCVLAPLLGVLGIVVGAIASLVIIIPFLILDFLAGVILGDGMIVSAINVIAILMIFPGLYLVGGFHVAVYLGSFSDESGRSDGSLLGWLWWGVVPLAAVGAVFAVYTGRIDISLTGYRLAGPYALFLFTGAILWTRAIGLRGALTGRDPFDDSWAIFWVLLAGYFFVATTVEILSFAWGSSIGASMLSDADIDAQYGMATVYFPIWLLAEGLTEIGLVAGTVPAWFEALHFDGKSGDGLLSAMTISLVVIPATGAVSSIGLPGFTYRLGSRIRNYYHGRKHANEEVESLVGTYRSKLQTAEKKLQHGDQLSAKNALRDAQNARDEHHRLVRRYDLDHELPEVSPGYQELSARIETRETEQEIEKTCREAAKTMTQSAVKFEAGDPDVAYTRYESAEETFDQALSRASEDEMVDDGFIDEKRTEARRTFTETVTENADVVSYQLIELLTSGENGSKHREFVSAVIDAIGVRYASRVDDAADELDAGALADAESALDAAKVLRDWYRQLTDMYEIRAELPATSREYIELRDELETEQAAEEVDTLRSEAVNRFKEAETAFKDDEFEPAETAYRAGLETAGKAHSIAESHGLPNAPKLKDERKQLRKRFQDIVITRHGETQEAIRDTLDIAADAVEAERFEEAIESSKELTEHVRTLQRLDERFSFVSVPESLCDRAVTEQLQTLATVVASISFPDPDDADGKYEEPLALLSTVEERLESFPEDERQLYGIDIEDFEQKRRLVLTETHRKRVRGELLAALSTMFEAESAFRTGEFSEGKQRYETAYKELEAVGSLAERHDVTRDTDTITEALSVCETNIDRSRKGELGISMDEQPEPTEPLIPGGSVDDDAADIGTPKTGQASATQQQPLGVGSPSDSELPDHEQLEWIGSGGNATVYKVRIEETGEICALKMPRLQSGKTLSSEVSEQFIREAKTWKQVDDHDNIVDVIGYGMSSYPWLLLEYLPTSLRTELQTDPGSVSERCHVLASIADGLQHAHHHGVNHLDIKPENILLGADGTAKIGDWGLARVILEHSQTHSGLTPAYSAPEQLTAESGALDWRTDIYQLGVLAYEVLTGEKPYETDRPLDLHRQIREGAYTPPTEQNSDLPATVDKIIGRAMATEKDDRYETAAALRRDLQSVTRDKE